MIFTKQTKGLNEAKNLYTGDYKKVNVLSWHSKDTEYYELSPYHLKTDGREENFCYPGVLFENYYQSCKVYKYVRNIKVYSHHTQRNNPNGLWWDYQCTNGIEEAYHEKDINNPNDDVNDKKVTNGYYNWRNSLWMCKNPIRYPVGFHERKNCLFSIGEIFKNGKWEEKRYNYLEARKNIYMKEYIRLIRQLPIYKKFLNDVKNGVNIIITEVDLPSSNKKGSFNKVDTTGFYYPTLESLNILLNDPSEAFGHGLCLTYALLEDLS